MSISELVNAAAARRPDIRSAEPPKGTIQIAAAASTAPNQAPAQQQDASGTNAALHLLFGYIPTEIVTVYVAVQAAFQPSPPAGTGTSAASVPAVVSSGQWIAFWLFFVLTPIVVWVLFATKLKDAGKPLPLAYGTWPVWEMFAGLIAYCAWAFAMPNTPFRACGDWYSPTLAGVVVVFISAALGLLAPLFQRPLGT